MNRAWVARRAKREIRTGGDLKDMRFLLRLRWSEATRVAHQQGYQIRIVLNDAG